MIFGYEIFSTFSKVFIGQLDFILKMVVEVLVILHRSRSSTNIPFIPHSSMFDVLQFAPLFFFHSFFCSLVVKNQPLCQTFCQFGPILPHFCGNLIKKKQKKQQKTTKNKTRPTPISRVQDKNKRIDLTPNCIFLIALD